MSTWVADWNRGRWLQPLPGLPTTSWQRPAADRGGRIKGLLEAARDLRAAAHGLGTGFVLARLAGRAVGNVAWVQRLYVFSVPFPEVPPPTPALPEGISIEPFSGPDWTELDALAPRYFRARVQYARANGRFCVVARRAGRIVGFIWAGGADQAASVMYPVTPPADAINLHLLYVAPEERGRGVAAALQWGSSLEAHRRGYRRAVGLLTSLNRSSARVLHRIAGLGVRTIEFQGRVTLVRLFSRRWGRWTPGEQLPAVHARLRAAADGAAV